MPPFVNTDCTYCGKSNRFDLAELRKRDTALIKDIEHRVHEEKQEEYAETCQQCGKRFKFTVKGDENGAKK